MSITIDSAAFIRTVKEELANKGWSQAQLSEKTGFSRPQMSRLLAGKSKRVQQSTVSKVLQALDIDKDTFLATVDIKSSAEIATNQPQTIYSDRLPTVTGQFIGRAPELEVIDKALHNDKCNILQIIALGGTGKTKLLRQWLDYSRDSEQSVIAWSFYSEATSTDKQVSANSFFQHAFTLLGGKSKTLSSDEDKGDYLASLLRMHSCLLILDGIESLQYADAENRGEIKDKALSHLLRNLAGQSGTFCIVTSRLATYELSDRASVKTLQLQNLMTNDGVALLQSLGVTGSEKAIKQAVVDYDGHALALSLLGNLLRLRYHGDIEQRSELPQLFQTGTDKTSRHAFKVMQSYEDWLSGTAELRLLYLLGLFDRPVSIATLEALWQANIPELTTDIEELEWYQAIESLRDEYRLLNIESDAEPANQTLDCHPLVREYFRGQLKNSHPEAWHAAHRCLFEYYQALPEKELPDTSEEMKPLFEAVKHGCLAKLYEKAYEVYWRRVYRGNEGYASMILGEYGENLSTVSHFFDKPWDVTTGHLTEDELGTLVIIAMFDLFALGRVQESEQTSKSLLESLKQEENWPAATQLSLLVSQQQLILGNIKDAISTAELSISFPVSADEPQDNRKLPIALLYAQYQSGDINELDAFILTAVKFINQLNGEETLVEESSALSKLYLIPEYGEVLLGHDQTTLLEKKEHVHKWSTLKNNASPSLSMAFTLIGLSNAFLALPDIKQALDCAESAVKLIRQSNAKSMIPLGLLTQAALYRETNNFPKAYQRLQEIYDIAAPSGMRLYLTDYHLEMARTLLKQWQQRLIDDTAQSEIQSHVAAALKLINETGYHRRDKEIEALAGPIQTTPEKQKKWSEEW